VTPKQPGAAPALFEGDGAIGFDEKLAVEHVRASDAVLARLIDAVGPFDMQLQATQSTFGALLEAIVYQQLNGKAAAAIFARVSALSPRSRGGPTAAGILRTSDDDLRGAGLSRAKVLAVHDLARKAVDGDIPTIAQAHKMDDDALVERLTMVRGIGRWTAEMFLIFRLGRPDVLPIDDYGIRKGYAVAFKKRALPDPKDVARRGERWRPYRTVASWYLWRAAE
jgi:3-methyladenine DNA glycosylase/8-oxoguanine DNA glycosylase